MFQPGFLSAPTPFIAGTNISNGSIYEVMQDITKYAIAPSTLAGGTLTINGAALGSYDVAIKGSTTVSSFLNSDWFTTTADSRSSLIVVKGDLTINAGQIFTPSNRKLFMSLYVTGNLILNGQISMSQRGANHSTSGSNITAAIIRIATGTYSSVLNPEIPSAGGTGATAPSGTNVNTSGNPGNTGSSGGTGGGGSGSAGGTNGGYSAGGNGARGTCFSGGSAGGGSRANGSSYTAQDGDVRGGAGGYGYGNDNGAGGGAGNPGGAGYSSGFNGGDGTGGVLVVFVRGIFSGTGTITAAGAKGGDASSGAGAGGGSGGGSVTVMYGTDSSSITPTALGGAFGSASNLGGAGGNGTARKLAL